MASETNGGASTAPASPSTTAPSTSTTSAPSTSTTTPPSTATAAATPNIHDSPHQLDVKKLHSLPSEQQDLYLLTFSSDLSRHVAGLDDDGASADQIWIKKELFQIINLPSPAPTRVIRNNLGRCFAGIFAKGSRKLLYESINDLVAIIVSSKDKNLKAKHAAVHCLGSVFEAAGDSAISLSSLACTSILRLLKSASAHAGLRSAVYRALGRVVKGIGESMDEQIARDIWKSARNAAPQDKALLVQASATCCLEQMFKYTSYFDNSNDYEKLQLVVWRTIESPSIPVRHSAASFLATVLIKSYSEIPNRELLAKTKKSKKTKKAPTDEPEDEIERPSTPTQKPITALSFSLVEILKQLSLQYNRPITTNRARAGIAVCYKYLLNGLGEGIVERNYSAIATHFFNDLLGHPSLAYNRYRNLITRKFVRILMQHVVQPMLGETSQLNAATFLINDILKDYPQALRERPEPTKQALTAALSALIALIKRLDAAINSIADLCREALLQVVQHPSYTVQVHASRCMRAFVLACPQQLLPTVTICTNSVTRELGFLGTQKQGPKRCVGFANGLAAVLSTCNQQPLYGSVDVYSRVLTQATSLLKSSGNSELRISSTQIQVAWIMIGGLMSLGPNFVKIHLAQLLLLWKNALPLPLPNMNKRTNLELSFLAHVRECALASLMAFLQYNSKLLTTDVSKRLAVMLENTATFLGALPDRKPSENMAERLSPSLQLLDFDHMVRRRVFQCYALLVTSSSLGASEIALQSNILPLAVSSFADPDRYVASSLSVQIASSAGAFESIWTVGDNFGFGVNGLMKGLDYEFTRFESRKAEKHWTSQDNPEAAIDTALLSPICGAWEHDSTTSYVNTTDDSADLQPQPPTTEVINTSIGIFALIFPLQSPKIQESILEQISTFLSSMAAQRDPAQRAALTANVALAVLIALKVTNGEGNIPARNLQSATAEKTLQQMLHTFIVDPDENIRIIAAEALGRLCSISGNDLTTREVQDLINLVVTNREPHARAGCALALANIHAQLGGMAASFHLKNILGILMSLAADSHPVVHFWALESLCKIVDSAGLTFSGYVSSTIGLLGQLYVFDTHNAEGPSQASSDLEMELATTAANARCIDSLINVLGPDLQEMAKPRDMMLTLIRQLQLEEDTLALVESTRCLGDLSVYAPGHMEFTIYVKRLQKDLDHSSPEVQDIAIQGLANLMRRDTEEIIRTADSGLEEKLWDILDQNPERTVVKEIFTNWLEQTGLSDTAGWIQRINAVLTKSKARIDENASKPTQKAPAGPDLQDEEAAGFASAAGAKEEDEGTAASTMELMRWQVRLFAISMLSELLGTISKDVAANDETPALGSLQQRISDVVRIAFSASTAGVVGLRVKGLHIVDQVLKLFGATPDPDFTEAMLLEQYQAQISSALTPAFAADSSPELAAEAINVCATFISSGIVRDVDRMGRILKLLVSAFENLSNPNAETFTIGELRGLSLNAQVMVRMAVYSAWAGLQIASAEQKYLVEVVKPYVARLTPLWLSSLQEYSRLRFEPEISSATGTSPLSSDLETLYAALNRQTLLKFYQESWLNLVDAIASLIDEDSESVFDALDGKLDPPSSPDAEQKSSNGEDNSPTIHTSAINYREEPVAFFFVLFGLTFEALVQRSSSSADSTTASARTLAILLALKKILRPSVSGNAIYQEVVFAETMDLLDRMVLTESADVQTAIVEIARNLCVGHPSSRHGITEEENDSLSDDIEQLFELTRIIVLVLAGLIPGLGSEANRSNMTSAGMTDESINLAVLSLNALVTASSVFPSIIRSDLHACIFHIFTLILSSPFCQPHLVPQALPIFRRFVIDIAAEGSLTEESSTQMQATLSRFLVVLKNAQKREIEHALLAEKNTLLAGAMLITSAPAAFAPLRPSSSASAEDEAIKQDESVLHRFLVELSDCLNNRMTTKISTGCIHSFLLSSSISSASPASHALSRYAAANLLPTILGFLTSPSDLEGMAESRTILASTLAAYAISGGGGGGGTSSSPHARSMLYSIAIPTLLTRAQREGRSTHSETAARLLELAAADAGAFRAVVGRMQADIKALLGAILQEASKGGVGSGGRGRANGGDGEDEEGTGKPAIELKMNF